MNCNLADQTTLLRHFRIACSHADHRSLMTLTEVILGGINDSDLRLR
jgi:hypothetical protein